MLTKSDFIKHEECPIWLWLYKSRPDLLPKETPELRRIFASGNEVDQLSRRLYPEGIEIEGHFEQGWINTQTAIKRGAQVMFQPTAMTQDGLLSQADILVKVPGTDTWNLLEVKSSTRVKEEHLCDVAFQRICFERAGIKINKTCHIHINNQYVREGDVEPEKLFVSEDITDTVLARQDATKTQIEEAKKIISQGRSPDTALVQKCLDPEKCEYLSHYIHGFPEIYSLVDSFPDSHIKALLDRGILDYTRLSQETLDRVGFSAPVFFETINTEGIKKELDKLVYPLYFFDYETYSAAIPPFDGTRPYQQLPFQYSLHIQKEKGGAVEHKEFLARTYTNPMPALLSQLKQDFGPQGSVLVWNSKFETARNEEMAQMYPEYQSLLQDINNRMFDLMLLFKFDRELYLHSDFHRSASLKKVLPVICPELNYADLEIKEGGTASASWPLLTGDTIAQEEKDTLANNLLKYCGRDTEAMVGILKHLQEKIK